MLKHQEAHHLRQRDMQVRDLSGTPETQRPGQFLYKHLNKAERVAKRAAKIKLGDRNMVRVFGKARDRLDRMQDVLSNLHQTLGDPPYPPECRVRGSVQPQSGHARRRP